MPRKRSEPSLRPSKGDRQGRAEEVIAGPWFPVLTSAVAVLFTTRFFLPAESADQGETLWIVVLWLACGVAWLADTFRQGEGLRRFDLLDAGLGLLVGGHVISAISVLMTEGHKRAALNMLWEWIGVGVAGLLIRAVIREQGGRERLLACLLISGVVLSGVGTWQHYVWYPEISAQFAELGELQQKSRQEEYFLSTSQRLRLQELRKELGLSLEGDETSILMLRDRILSSTEPIGRFALANTFAALLLVALILGLAIMKTPHSGTVELRRWTVGVVVLTMIAYCLLLTKSRTAMVGLMVAGSLGLLFFTESVWRSHWGRRAVVGVIVGMAALVAVAFVSGSLDREVISETPKSLKYRLEYWTSTTKLIREHPLLGAGPGNFRQSYLKYKLPESSEEILDPHNFLLDVWVNGGLIALAGLVCLLGVTIRRCFRFLTQNPLNESLHRESLMSEMLLRGGIGMLAMVIAALVELFLGTEIRSDWIWLATGWWIVSLLLTWASPRLTSGTLSVMAGFGLFVHLSGAGGIAMPVVTQIALALIFLIDALATNENPGVVLRPVSVPRSRAIKLISIAFGFLGIVACAKTAALPVTKSRMSLLEGRAAMATEGKSLVAIRTIMTAAEQDPLSPEPWQELARVHLGQWLGDREDQTFESAVEAQKEAIDHDPKSPSTWRAMGQLWWQRFELTSDEDAAASAFAGFDEAALRYPHLAALQAELAMAAQATGEADRARQAATRALRLDELNRKSQHVDKFLSRDLLSKMRKIAESAAISDEE